MSQMKLSLSSAHSSLTDLEKQIKPVPSRLSITETANRRDYMQAEFNQIFTLSLIN